jgi:hypothetical protein
MDDELQLSPEDVGRLSNSDKVELQRFIQAESQKAEIQKSMTLRDSVS